MIGMPDDSGDDSGRPEKLVHEVAVLMDKLRATAQANGAAPAEDHDAELGPLTGEDWTAARKALGRGSRWIVFGTSRKALDDAVERLSKASQNSHAH
jgi:hypothetical protein